MKKLSCNMCLKEIKKGEANFYFPHMPKWHRFFEFSGKCFHTRCIKALDKEGKIGDELAYITEDIAKKSDNEPYIIRDKNIVVRGRLDEKSVEIVDFENYVEFAVPIINLDIICNMKPLDVIQNRMTALRLLEYEKLELITKFYTTRLETLSFTRLKEMIRQIDLTIFCDGKLAEVNHKCMIRNQKNRRSPQSQTQ